MKLKNRIRQTDAARMPLVYILKLRHDVSTFVRWMTSRLYFAAWAFCEIRRVGTVLEMGKWLGILQYICWRDMPGLVLLQLFFYLFFLFSFILNVLTHLKTTTEAIWCHLCFRPRVFIPCASSSCFQHTFLLQRTATNHVLRTMNGMLRVSTNTYRAPRSCDAQSRTANTGSKQIMKPMKAPRDCRLFFFQIRM